MKRIEDNRMVKLFFFFSETFFLEDTLKKSTHSLCGAWLFLLVHIRLTPSEGPKDFVS